MWREQNAEQSAACPRMERVAVRRQRLGFCHFNRPFARYLDILMKQHPTGSATKGRRIARRSSPCLRVTIRDASCGPRRGQPDGCVADAARGDVAAARLLSVSVEGIQEPCFGGCSWGEGWRVLRGGSGPGRRRGDGQGSGLPDIMVRSEVLSPSGTRGGTPTATYLQVPEGVRTWIQRPDRPPPGSLLVFADPYGGLWFCPGLNQGMWWYPVGVPPLPVRRNLHFYPRYSF